MTPPRFARVGPGVYDSVDGRFTLYRLLDVYPPAWNVDLTTDYAYENLDLVAERGDTLVDGARTKRHALALFKDAYEAVAATLPPYEPGGGDD